MKNIAFYFCSLLWTIGAFSQFTDLSLDKSVDNQFVNIGDTVTFTIQVSNDSPTATRGVQVMDRLPSGYEFLSARTTAGIYEQHSGIWNIDRLGAGNSVVLTLIARVKDAGDYLNTAEIIANDTPDTDSVPNNGIDTDKDGNIVDDPQDEDDGDGQFVIVAVGDKSSKTPGMASGECLAPLDAESSFPANSATEINSVFKFDYKIEAVVTLGMGGATIDNSRFGNELRMNYYVNSADGSMFFPGGDMGFFSTNFTNLPTNSTIDGAIWLANGQIVSYAEDRDGQKRAITRESSQTASGRFGTDYLSMMQFFRTSQQMAELPAPLPSYVTWPNSSKGYRAELIESHTGLTNTWDMYFDTAPTPIKTSTIMMGFMAGVLKDARNAKCNRLLIYTKVNIGGLDTGEYMETVLKSIRPAGMTFDATGYQPLLVAGDPGTDIAVATDHYESRMRSIEIRRQTLERRRCNSDSCWKQKNADLEDLRKEKSQVICEMMVKNGMESSMAECMAKEQ